MTPAEQRKAYRQTPEGKEAVARTNKKYRESEHGKAYYRAWIASDKGKAALKRASKRYWASPKGKAAKERARAKAKEAAAQSAGVSA